MDWSGCISICGYEKLLLILGLLVAPRGFGIRSTVGWGNKLLYIIMSMPRRRRSSGLQRGERWTSRNRKVASATFAEGYSIVQVADRPIRFLWLPGWEIISLGAAATEEEEDGKKRTARPLDTYWNLFICQYFHPTFANNSTCNWLTVHWGVPCLPTDRWTLQTSDGDLERTFGRNIADAS